MKTPALKTLLATFIVAATSAFAADKAAIESHSLSYHAAGKAVVEMALTKKVDAAEVEKKVDTMLADAVWAAGEYAKAYPKGEKLLKVILSNVAAMKELSFKDLEHNWHDLHHFDAADKDIGLDLKAEDNEHFTDPIHSIVHPILVLKAAQAYAISKGDADLKAIKEEMEEGLEQMEKMKGALLKK